MAKVCKPYSDETREGGWCFGSLLCKVLGVRFDEQCMKCFAAAGVTFDNDARPEHYIPVSSRRGTVDRNLPNLHDGLG
jgi:hypothetical protein